jgi:ribonucleoside-diphosphate reductase alpha chain
MLRNKLPIKTVIEIIDSMHVDSTSLNNWKSGVIRALKEFITDGTESSEECPNCKTNLVYVNGCKQCNNCG